MKEKQKVKNARGITLVALVVTIIVLIILAGVSISLVLGENGIITKARYAKQATLNAQVAEQEQLNEAVVYLESIGENSEEDTPPVEYAPYDNPYIPKGFIHTGEGTWNSGYVIRQESTGDEFVWVPCVLDQTKVKEGDTVVTFGKITTGKYNESGSALLPTDTSVEAEDSSVSEIETSVGTYGGFYIARYEAGIEGTTDNYSLTTKTATDGSVKPLSQAGKGVWNYITRTDAITVSKAMIDQIATGAKSTLISGAAWDTTLQWMVNASDNKTTNTGYDTDSTDKGNYSGSISTTGYYAINNIYDMSGNVWDWTTENCTFNGNSYVVVRGGNFFSSGSDTPAAYRGSSIADATNGFGLRVLLYK